MVVEQCGNWERETLGCDQIDKIVRQRRSKRKEAGGPAKVEAICHHWHGWCADSPVRASPGKQCVLAGIVGSRAHGRRREGFTMTPGSHPPQPTHTHWGKNSSQLPEARVYSNRRLSSVVADKVTQETWNVLSGLVRNKLGNWWWDLALGRILPGHS